MRPVSRLLAVFGALSVLTLLPGPAAAEKRIALVIGINDYPLLKRDDDPKNGQLSKAIGDARTMGETLASLGFDVDIATNVDRASFLSALDRLKQRTSAGDTVFIFFAGHGVALKGSNLLLPSDIPPVDAESENLIRGMSISDADVIEAAREKSAGLIILALDACRDNPIEEYARRQARAQGRAYRSAGLMRSVGLDVRATSGVYAIYSAANGQRALDSLGESDAAANSVFTRIFARRLREPVHLTEIMETVKEEVAALAATVPDAETKRPHRQHPAYYNETLGGRIFLAGLPRDGAQRPSAAATPAAPDPAAQAWAAIRDTTSTAVLEEFARQFANTPFAPLARARIAELRKLQQQAALPKANVTHHRKLTGKYKAVLGGNGEGEMEIRTNPDGSQYFAVEVFFENGHSCALSGTAMPFSGNWRYMDGSTCVMELRADAQGKLSIKTDVNKRCGDYCGARASLSDLDFRRSK